MKHLKSVSKNGSRGSKIILLICITTVTMMILLQIDTGNSQKTVDKPKQIIHNGKVANKPKISRKYIGRFTATAYTLWENSSRSFRKEQVCTKDGTNLKYKSRRQAMTIAVDKNIIPLGTRVYIKFNKPYEYMNGYYTAHDTGRYINGRHIDIFFGCRTKVKRQDAIDFGKRSVKVYIERKM